MAETVEDDFKEFYGQKMKKEFGLNFSKDHQFQTTTRRC